MSVSPGFFTNVFGREHKGYVCLAFRGPGRNFREQYFAWPDQLEEIVQAAEEEAFGADVYFCPQLLETKRRTKDNIAYAPCAYSDLDYCAPSNLLVEPTVVWESSPKRYQALWMFESRAEVAPNDAEEISRRIAYHHREDGADISGWDLTQLLRVPGTFNHKYGKAEPPMVQLIHKSQNVYRLSDFNEYPAVQGGISDDYDDMPEELKDLPDGTAAELLQKYKSQIPTRIFTLFTEVPSGTDDWSGKLWSLQLALMEAGFEKEDVYRICREAGCNKFSRDKRPEVYLWREVCRGWLRHQQHEKLMAPEDDEDLEPLMSDEERLLVAKAPDTFIERYVKYASSLGDASPQYHQAGAFIILSGLMPGSMRLKLSNFELYTNMWFLLLADSTLTRKSTAMRNAMKLLSAVDDDAIVATDASTEGLFSALSQRANRPSLFHRDEFTGLLESMAKKDYMADLQAALTKFYDGDNEKRTLRKEIIEVKQPRFSILAGGIKSKTMALVTDEMMASGFMPRFVVITAEPDPTRRQPLRRWEQRSTEAFDALVEELTELADHYNREQTLRFKDKREVTTPVTWEMDITDEAMARVDELDRVMAENGIRHPNQIAAPPALERLGKSIIKAAMLIAASRQRDEKVCIELIDVLRAIKYGEEWVESTLELLGGVGKGTFERELDRIVRMVAKAGDGGLTRSTVMQHLHLTAKSADAALETLEQRGMIQRSKTGRGEKLVIPQVEREAIIIDESKQEVNNNTRILPDLRNHV